MSPIARQHLLLLSLLVIGTTDAHTSARRKANNNRVQLVPSLKRIRYSRHHAQIMPPLQRLHGGFAGPQKQTNDDAAMPSVEELWRDSFTIMKRFFSVVAISCNPLAWCTQWVSRFIGSRWYAIWFVRNHVSWQRLGPLVKISRFRYRTPECPSVVSVRPCFGCNHLEVWNAWADLVVVPGVIDRVLLRAELGRRENTDEKGSKIPKEARFCVTAMVTILWWALRVTHHRDRVTPVLSLFGSSGIERIAGRVARDCTLRQMDSGTFDIAADAQSLCGLSVRVTLAWWMDRTHAIALSSLALTPWLLGGSAALKRDGRGWLPWYAVLLAVWRLAIV